MSKMLKKHKLHDNAKKILQHIRDNPGISSTTSHFITVVDLDDTTQINAPSRHILPLLRRLEDRELISIEKGRCYPI